MAKRKKHKDRQKHYQPPPRDTAVRPTPERMSRGTWTEPKGMDKHERPVHDAASDMIGQLHCAKQITDDQCEAARDAQEAWHAYVAELGVNTGRSCLDIGPVGYQGDDGNPEAIRRWRGLTAGLSTWQYGALVWTACQDHRPANIRLLRDALDILADRKKGVAVRKNRCYV